MKWEAYDKDAAGKAKTEAIEAYMSNKTRESDFRQVVGRLLYDYIDYGNAFCDVEFQVEYKIDSETGEQIPGYIGPRLKRISPYDIVFNPLATSFEESPKIVRKIKTIGELKKMAKEQPDNIYLKEAIPKLEETRSFIGGYSADDVDKALGYTMDGFGDIYSYYTSNYVEILEFEGDIHDHATGQLLENKIITVVDRTTVISVRDMPSWMGKGYKYHVGWRMRPDNLYGMGPLDNLVGMQYRIDHLENLKADAQDLSVHPPLVVVGDVEEFEYGPGEEIHIDGDGSVTELGKNLNGVISAANEIAALEARMELFAGAPREAMGVRSPGEKTAFEVQQLQTAAGRIFQEKITNFEVSLLEKVLNAMLEISRRNMHTSDIVRVIDDDLGVTAFVTITKEDISANGIIRPIGARHFGEQAQILVSLQQALNSGYGAQIAPHTSGIALAKLLEDSLQIERWGIFSPNVAILEQAETQKMANAAQEEVDMADSINVDGDDFEE
jgi:hypothetical protein